MLDQAHGAVALKVRQDFRLGGLVLVGDDLQDQALVAAPDHLHDPGGGPPGRGLGDQTPTGELGGSVQSGHRYSAARASAWRRSTDTSWETPRSGMVTP